MFSKIVVAATALAALAIAAPMNIPRDPSVVTETTWTTVDVPVTVWVDQNGQALSTVAPGGKFAPAVPTSEHTNIQSSASPSTSSTSAVVVLPTTTPAPAVQAFTTTTTSAPTTTPPPYVPPIQSSPKPANAPSTGQSAADVIASTTNTCLSTSDACVGDITYYDGGLGACGWNVNTATDMQIALPYGFMGTQSNGNPYCGKSLTIMNPTTGATVQATVGDKCMGCTDRSIDLTNALFAAIGGGCDGRCSGFEWWFN